MSCALPQVLNEMLDFNVLEMHDGEIERRWVESERATCSADFDLDSLLTEAPLPIQTLAKWMLAMRLVMQVTITIRREEASPDARRDASGANGSAAADTRSAAADTISAVDGAHGAVGGPTSPPRGRLPPLEANAPDAKIDELLRNAGAV